MTDFYEFMGHFELAFRFLLGHPHVFFMSHWPLWSIAWPM